MTDYEKILELLDKKELTEEDKLLLSSLLKSSDKDIPKYYELIKNIVKNASHLLPEETADYVLIKNNLEPADISIFKKVPFIEAHLSACEKCSSEFKYLAEEYAGAEEMVSGYFLPDEPNSVSQHPVNTAAIRSRGFARYAYSSVMVIFITAAALFIASEIITPDYYHYASPGSEKENFVTRGRGTGDFDRSLVALEEKDYDEAVRSLKEDIKNSEGDETLFYSHYILGLTYLEKSEKSVLGLFKSFDEHYAGLALEEFNKTVELNNSGRFTNINLNAHYYAAKANLMLGNLEEAKEELRIVINNKGGRMDDAKKILNGLK